MVKQLGEMGFNECRAARAIYNTGSNSLEASAPRPCAVSSIFLPALLTVTEITADPHTGRASPCRPASTG